MGAALVTIPVPATPGPGAWVDISGLIPVVPILNCFAADSDVIFLEQSYDGGTNNAGAIQGAGFFNTGPGTIIVEAEGNAIRANRASGTGGAYNLHTCNPAGQTLGDLQTINVPANPGSVGNPSAGLDVSVQPMNLNLTANQGATPLDNIRIECSIDGANWAPFTVVQGLQIAAVICGANFLRTNRLTAGNACVLQVQGVPFK